MKKFSLLAAALMLASFFAVPAHAETYDEAIQLAWGDGRFQSSVDESFVGEPVIAPGSQKKRTLRVKNEGPNRGTLVVTLKDVLTAAPNAVDEHHNPDHQSPGQDYTGAGPQGDFYEDLKIRWTIEGQQKELSFREARESGDMVIGTYDLEQEEFITLTMGYVFPAEATAGNTANVEKRIAEFAVNFKIEGEDKTSGGDEEPPGPGLPNAGGPALGLLVGGVGLLGAGLALLRRRSREEG